MTLLEVSLGRTSVGWLAFRDGRSTFGFDGGYLEMPGRPILGQWFEDRLDRRTREFRWAVPPWFENLLPERGGRVRRRLTREIGCAEEDDPAILCALGADLPGAVRVIQGTWEPSPAAGSVVAEAVPVLSPGLRASLGGMQLKFSLSGSPDRLTLPVHDHEDGQWILKVADEATFPELAQNEAALSRWVRAAGFDVPEVHVVPRDGFPDLGALGPTVRWGFLIRRYDRTASGRVHQEDFLQVLGRPASAKYDATHALGLGQLVRQILGPSGVREYLRRTVVVVATGNGDAHLKNWSLLYPNGIQPTFTPLYDQVATIAYPDLGRSLALRLGNARDFGEVSSEVFRFAATKLGFDDVDQVVDEVLTALASSFDPEAHGVPPAVLGALRDHWRRVPLLAGRTLLR
ncbi:MAG: HipA domain-containing protein [Myxococcota bacterium]